MTRQPATRQMRTKHAAATDTTKEHLVRPRWVWGGTCLLVTGTVVVGIGVAITSWPWSIVGLIVTTLGAGGVLRGGILYDVRTSGAVQAEIRDVVEGNVHPGVVPGETVSTPASRRKAREVDRRRVALERASIKAPRPSLVRPAAGMLLLVALFLLVSQWELYPIGLPGQTNATRSLGCAIVLALVGLRILTAQPHQGLRISSGLSALAGLLLILNGSLARHDRLATAVAEVICGVVSCVAAAVVFTHDPP